MRYLLLALLLSSAFASAEVFKTINPDGSTSYSDVKTEGAEAITPPELTPTPAVKLPKKKVAARPAEENKALGYKSFSISSPANNAVVRNNNGDVHITLSITPALQTSFKHSITVLLDGKPVKSDISTTQVKLSNIDRGMHSISAQIIEDKKIIKSASPVTIHVKRQSKLHGKNIPLWPSLTPTETTQAEQSAL